MNSSMSLIVTVIVIVAAAQLVYWIINQKKVRSSLREVESAKAVWEECAAGLRSRARGLKNALDEDPECTGENFEQIKQCYEAYVRELQRAVSVQEAYQNAARSASDNLEKQRMITNMMGGSKDMSSLFYYANASKMNKVLNKGNNANVDIATLERARAYITRFLQ